MQEQVMSYIGENALAAAVTAVSAVLLLQLLALIQVTRTRREVHGICKKIRKYLEVVFTEEEPGVQEMQKENMTVEAESLPPVYQPSEEWQKQQEEKRKNEADAKLLIEVISEVF